MIEIIQANNVKVIMCSYPVSDVPLYMVHRNVADRYKLYFVDLREIFQKIPGRHLYISSDGWHPNEKGYEIIAQKIYNVIVNERLLEQ